MQPRRELTIGYDYSVTMQIIIDIKGHVHVALVPFR